MKNQLFLISYWNELLYLLSSFTENKTKQIFFCNSKEKILKLFHSNPSRIFAAATAQILCSERYGMMLFACGIINKSHLLWFNLLFIFIFIHSTSSFWNGSWEKLWNLNLISPHACCAIMMEVETWEKRDKRKMN